MRRFDSGKDTIQEGDISNRSAIRSSPHANESANETHEAFNDVSRSNGS